MKNEYIVEGKLPELEPNTIKFFNAIGGENIEVLRLSKDGITANPNVPTDEAAKAVLRAVDGYLKQAYGKAWVNLIRGVRVENDTVIVTARGGNDSAREICAALLKEMNP